MTFFEIVPYLVAGWLAGLLMFIGFAVLVAWRETQTNEPRRAKRELLDISLREPLRGTVYDQGASVDPR